MDPIEMVQEEMAFMARWRGPNSVEVRALRDLLRLLLEA